MDNELYITVPITDNFNHTKIIGELKILKSELPAMPNFVFSLGYRALELDYREAGKVPRSPYYGKYELQEVSIVTDLSYVEYLRQVNVLSNDIN